MNLLLLAVATPIVELAPLKLAGTGVEMRARDVSRRNMGQADRAIRFFLGLTCLYVALIIPDLLNDVILNTVVAVFGVMNVISAFIRICPAYLVANFSTDKGNRNRFDTVVTEDSFAEDQASDEATESNRWLSVRGKLFLSVVVPMLLVFLLFTRGYYQIAHELGMKELSAQNVFVSELALNLHEMQGSELGTLPERSIFDSKIGDIEALILHDRVGKQVDSPYTIFPENPDLQLLLVQAVQGADLHTAVSAQGMLMHAGKHHIWSSVPSKDGTTWASTVLEAPHDHSVAAMLMSPSLLIIFLGVVWVSVWSSIYIVNKFVEKTAEGAKRLQHQMLHDTLTKLPNMMKFDDLLESKLQLVENSEQGVAVLLLDLAGFRDVNDTLGYKLGDTLLTQIAKDLKELVPSDEVVLRVGGDVFCILCTTAPDRSDSTRLANCIHDNLEVHKELDGVPLALHGRIGISCYPLDTQEPSQLVRMADIALAQAKQSHLKTCHYQSRNDSHSIRKLSLLARLRGAIENDEMSLVYQPKVDIQNHTVVGVEALVRWVDQEYGPVSPIEFVTYAEKSGLIDKLTHWVLRAAEQQNKEWVARGIQLPIAVNLSPLNLHDPQLISLVHELTTKGSFGANMLELELTENAVMSDPATALNTMNTLHDMGVKFAIDDFGTGLSSFSYLRKFPISHLKIDRVFVVDPDCDDRDAVLLKSMINLGHSLECVVTAEGVEDQKTLDSLMEHGCDYVQGYHVCKPKSSDDLARWYSQSDWNETSKVA